MADSTAEYEDLRHLPEQPDVPAKSSDDRGVGEGLIYQLQGGRGDDAHNRLTIDEGVKRDAVTHYGVIRREFNLHLCSYIGAAACRGAHMLFLRRRLSECGSWSREI